MITSRRINWAGCSTHGDEQKCMQSFDGKARRKDVSRRIIFKLIFGKCGGVIWN
jgi:hypothetical protein